MKKTRFSRRGFTAIEVATSLIFVGGSMAMLLPSFGDAREKARLATCQSNMGQIAKALVGYINDLSTIPVRSSGFSWAPWSFGGWSGINREFWQSSYPPFNIQTRDRPLSVYMTPWEIPEQEDPYTPTQEMPIFKCPSDTISAQWQWTGLGGGQCRQDVLSAYNDVGTSYQMNFHWWDQVQDSSGDWDVLLGYYGPQIFRKYMALAPSRFITLMEDAADYGFGYGAGGSNPGIQVPGFHGEFSKHVVAFADAHVEYLYLDTRHLHDSVPDPPGPRHGQNSNCGTWTVCDWQLDHVSGSRHSGSDEECP